MALERQAIERKDFPTVEGGYDPAAVDAHLSALAREVEELRGSNPPGATLASAVSERVRGIVEAAERSASEILSSAELEAQETRAQASHAAELARQEATGQAQREREQAAARARDYVRRLSSSVAQMLERLEGLDSELGALTSSLRTGTERLRGELASLEDELEDVIGASGREMADEEAPAPLSQPAAAPYDVSEPAVAPIAFPRASEFSEPPAQYSSESEKIGDRPFEERLVPGAEAGFEEPRAPASDDSEGARLIALNMALNGTPREETDRYLAANYDLADRERLLDEVYASIQG